METLLVYLDRVQRGTGSWESPEQDSYPALVSTFPVAIVSFRLPKKLTEFGYHLASGLDYSFRRFIRDTEIALWYDDLPALRREMRELRLKLMHPHVVEGGSLSSPWPDRENRSECRK